MGKDSSATIDAAPQETRNNTRHANFHAGWHREPPKLHPISATSFGLSPARVRHVEGGPFCEKPTKHYWNRAILTALKARSNFQVRIKLGFNISAGLKSRLNLVSKFKRPFVNSCQIQILQKHLFYRAIKSDHDHQILQEDLHNLTKWASDWQMDFNTSKCHLLRNTNKRKPFQSTYSANSEVLAKAPQCDYLGVRCSESLRWGAHCSKVAAKANKTLGLIRRTLKPCCREVKERAYMTLVRPTIEYASSTWNPHTNTDVNRLEQVQKNAARFVCNDYNSATSTSALVSSLGWDNLEHRRLFNQSVLFYKFHNGLVNCKLPDSVTRCSSRSLTRSHHLAYQRPQSNILTHCYSFFPRTLRVWNSLPCEVVTSPSLDSFRHTALPAIRSLKVPSHLHRL